MTATDWAEKANSALASTGKPKPEKKTPRKRKRAKEAEPEREFETRFGALAHWGGAMDGGATVPIPDDEDDR